MGEIWESHFHVCFMNFIYLFFFNIYSQLNKVISVSRMYLHRSINEVPNILEILTENV